MINVLYTCAAEGASGYSEASRNYIAALSRQPDINLAVRSVVFETFKTDQTKYSHILAPLMNKKIVPDVNIIHMTPENFPRYIYPGAKNVGYTVWETSRLPHGWAKLCNMLSEIWVPCDWNVDVFKSSGVIVPVKKVEHAIDLSQFENVEPAQIPGAAGLFKFYSIFQWTERKNPYGLIRAYLSEFYQEDNVVLVLKTYHMNHTPTDKASVENELKRIIKESHLKFIPRVSLIHEAMSRDKILGLHAAGDCFVLPHRAEGWGMVPFEAMAMGKPAISTNFGGNLEFMNDSNSYLIGSLSTPVSGMPWSIYDARQMWAEPDLADLKAKMRFVFNNREAAVEKGRIAKSGMDKYSWDSIGKKMSDNIKQLLESK